MGNSALTLASKLLAASFLVFSANAPATDRWEAHSGDPCCGIPEGNYKYLDANEACRTEAAAALLGWDYPCHTNPRNLRNDAGAQQPGACLMDVTCNCDYCGVGPGLPYEQIGVFAGKQTSKQPQNCGGLFAFLGLCSNDPPKGNGKPKPGLGCGNPCNVGSGNKFQVEPIYRTSSGSLDVQLFYNGMPGSTYFQRGPFGMRWSLRYATRVRDSGQGLVGVNSPDGRELEFRAPASGNVYAADADVTERLERLTDAGGNLVGWKFTSSVADETFTYDAKGVLSRISSRALTDETMVYSTAATPISIAPGEGLLIGVTDAFGRQISFTYDSQRRIATMSDPAGGPYRFDYDGPSGPAGANNLTKVTFPDGTSRTYFYDEPAQINGGASCATPNPALANALTGLQDEKGNRFATWTYDCQARVTSSQHALGTELYTFDYGTGTSTTVVDPLGTSRTVALQRTLGVAYNTGTTQPAANGVGNASNAFTYDLNGNVATQIDFDGNRTNYGYDLARNLETSRIEGLTASGATTPQTRTITTDWHPTFRLPTRIAEPLRITTNTYDPDGTQCGARGALCSKSVQATTDTNGSLGFGATLTGTARTWTYTYNSNGSVLRIDGPRTDVADVTTYTYYANNDPDLGKRGNVATITNALGHLTSITDYNAHGQPTRIVDPNGVPILLGYDPRQRLISRDFGGELTTYDHDFVGQLTKVTQPDNSYLSYDYDAAHRLDRITDKLGNYIAYPDLDPMGNRKREEVHTPDGALVQTRSHEYSNLNRLFRDISAQGKITEYGYDDQGNLQSITDPLNHITTNAYDALNRLKQVTDPKQGITLYDYDGLDTLKQVTDARVLATGYTVDGLGNLKQQVSPDTGTTTSTFDDAGNLKTQTDAKGQLTTYGYDELNRVKLITFQDNSTQTYTYDQDANAIGRLSSIVEKDAAGVITSQLAYGYNTKSRVASETRTLAGVQYLTTYSYDAFGRNDGMTYPSGRSLTYGFDGLGRIASITTTKDGQTTTVVQNVTYHPFGGVKSYTLGNNQVYTRGIDLDGRIASYTLGTQTFAIGYDDASRIAFISETGNPPNTNTYGYDELDRLTSAATQATGYGYSYDAVGNRSSRTGGANTDTYAYSSTSNRIASITPQSGPVRNVGFDANGSTTADGVNTYGYDTRGRMASATSSIGTTTYQVNALGQRIRKTNTLGDTVFHYDTRGHLIAETDPGGGLKRELIYLGDIPVGVVQ